MVDKTQSMNSTILAEPEASGQVNFAKFDRSSLSYASTFEDPWKRRMISAIELFTGKLAILRMVRRFERRGAPSGQAFWRAALDTMGIELQTPQEQLQRIPAEGPVIAGVRQSSRLMA